jgi:hypothetical protein
MTTDDKSFVLKILPISSLTSKILELFPRNLLIPQHRGEGVLAIYRVQERGATKRRSICELAQPRLASQGRSRNRVIGRGPGGSITLVIFASLRGVQHNEPVRNFQRVVTHMALPFLSKLWFDDQGQDIAEYAVTLAVILVIVAGTIRLVASNTNFVLWSSSSSVQ